MSKKYNLSSKSDMRKLSRDLKDSILDSTRNSIKQGAYDIECPHCNKEFKAHEGKNICPHCENIVDLKLDINF